MNAIFARKTPRRILLVLGSVAALTVPAATAGAAAGQSPDAAGNASPRGGCVVAYFDLGETLVHTAEDNSVRYMPRAEAHLRALRARHIPVGLITNVPSSWGATDAERAAKLKEAVNQDWKGSKPFAWTDFGDRIFTPRTEAERKPAPALWERAKKAAGGCRVVYQAETADEVAAGGSLGYFAYQTGRDGRPAYLPAPFIAALAQLPATTTAARPSEPQ
ncbi:hypothetical protein QOM21_35970 [Streptomyces sp. Pv4-95]|uniref:hypothetical protein n=1 Tax=Streptomyces sp. Pv4-95 TaxID=3049543 RepID=UPI00389269EC